MSKLWSSVLDLLWDMGGYGCHQIRERSFFYKGEQFPVCARCTGVAAGQALCVFLALTKKKLSNIHCILLLIPMGMDWLIQFVNIKESNNIRRFITGIFGGFAVFGLYINLFTYLWNKTKERFHISK